MAGQSSEVGYSPTEKKTDRLLKSLLASRHMISTKTFSGLKSAETHAFVGEVLVYKNNMSHRSDTECAAFLDFHISKTTMLCGTETLSMTVRMRLLVYTMEK